MSSYDDRDEQKESNKITEARAKLSTPGTLMILTAVLLILLSLVGIGIMVSGFDVSIPILEFFATLVPQGSPEHKQILNDLEEAKKRDRTFEYVQNGVMTVIAITLNILMLIAGLRMKSMRSYTLCMMGAIAGIIPLNSCCCLGFPIGLWALITLMNADVKAAFKSVADQGAGIDPDRGWKDDRDDDLR